MNTNHRILDRTRSQKEDLVIIINLVGYDNSGKVVSNNHKLKPTTILITESLTVLRMVKSKYVRKNVAFWSSQETIWSMQETIWVIRWKDHGNRKYQVNRKYFLNGS